MRYVVTKQFVSGNLKGIKIKETTNIEFKLNKKYKSMTSNYKVVKIEKI